MMSAQCPLVTLLVTHDTTRISLSLSALSVEMGTLIRNTILARMCPASTSNTRTLASSCFRTLLATTVCSTHQHIVLCDHQTEEAAEACQSEHDNERWVEGGSEYAC